MIKTIDKRIIMEEPKLYISPTVSVCVLIPEGVLCVSGNVVDYKQEEFEW